MNASRAFVLMLALALPAFGQTLTFKNEAGTTVVVQTATHIRGKLKSDRPMVLRAGALSTAIDLDSDKMITVYDGRSNRVLYQGLQKRSTTTPLKFSIQTDARAPNKVKLVPGSWR
jgi:hypothetical protein